MIKKWWSKFKFETFQWCSCSWRWELNQATLDFCQISSELGSSLWWTLKYLLNLAWVLLFTETVFRSEAYCPRTLTGIWQIKEFDHCFSEYFVICVWSCWNVISTTIICTGNFCCNEMSNIFGIRCVFNSIIQFSLCLKQCVLKYSFLSAYVHSLFKELNLSFSWDTCKNQL